ncbi:hypothetical protein TSAR_014015 [Trichomalopsis sarcophagae]|uniref:Uncharacterized protein n=1 Tax=Trichomalopsis sarcophagae TaxID=543379 RepID=A0A232F0D2_9HYME|nr:hypothetical protein TSAR_014015 [Trichomalopsis sarcophagae]
MISKPFQLYPKSDKIILSEVAKNLNRSLPSVSIEINESNCSFKDTSIVTSSTTTYDCSSRELWEKPELSRSITESMLVTSSPIVDKSFIKPKKSEAKIISNKILKETEKIDISKLKKSILSDTKDENDSNADQNKENESENLPFNDKDENDSNADQNKENESENLPFNDKELQDLPIVFIDEEGNLQNMSDVEIEIKKKINCDNEEPIYDLEMATSDINNDALDNNIDKKVSDDLKMTNLDISNDALDNNIDEKIPDDMKMTNLDIKLQDLPIVFIDEEEMATSDINNDALDNNIDEKIPDDMKMTNLDIKLQDLPIVFIDEEGNLQNMSDVEIEIKKKINCDNEEPIYDLEMATSDINNDALDNNIDKKVSDDLKMTNLDISNDALDNNIDEKIPDDMKMTNLDINQKTVPKTTLKGITINKKVMSDVFKFADTKKVGPHCLETGKKNIHGQKITDNQKYTDYLYSYLRKAAILKHNLQADFNDQFHVARTRRESDEDRTVSMYELCTTCSGFYAKSYYHKHVKKCTNNTKSTLQARIESNAAIGKKSASIKEHLQKVLLNLRKGSIKDIIEEDDVIITFGNGLSFKHRHHYHQGDMIRARLRCTARFLRILRNISNNTVKSYADFFKPEHFDYLFPAINEIGQYNQVTDLYDVPATAAAAGAYVKELCDTYIGMCIKAKDQTACDDAMKFLHLYKTDYNKYVTKTVAESQVEMQRNKKIELPTEEDLRLFYTSIISRRDELIDDLKNNGFNMTKWIELG